MHLQDLQNPKVYALLMGAGAGALLAPKASEIPKAATEGMIVALAAASTAIPLAMAHYAPAHPTAVGVLAGLAGAAGVLNNGANAGNVASLLIGGSLLWGSRGLKGYAALGLLAVGGLALGSGALMLARQRKNLLTVAAVSPVMPPVSAAPPPPPPPPPQTINV